MTIFFLLYGFVIDLNSATMLTLCFIVGHPNMGGPMRMNPPRGMGGMGPQVATCFVFCFFYSSGQISHIE